MLAPGAPHQSWWNRSTASSSRASQPQQAASRNSLERRRASPDFAMTVQTAVALFLALAATGLTNVGTCVSTMPPPLCPLFRFGARFTHRSAPDRSQLAARLRARKRRLCALRRCACARTAHARSECLCGRDRHPRLRLRTFEPGRLSRHELAGVLLSMLGLLAFA